MKRSWWCLLILLIVSCSKGDKIRVPYARVYFVVDLQFKDKELSAILINKTFTEPRNAGEYVGYSGLLVVHGIDDNYYAFDLCCPYDAQKSIRVVPTELGTTAVCAHCESEYDISYGGGYPVAGPSTYSLQRYNVERRGAELLIRH